MLIYSAVGALLLALVHFFAYKLQFSNIPRSKWLSAAGGISVSYVFVHLLPELQEWQKTFEEGNQESLSFLNHHLYLVALLGLAIFYGLERAAKLSRESDRQVASEQKLQSNGKIFDLHIVSFCLYNALIGYLLVNRDDSSIQELILFIAAMFTHFLVNDHGLLDHYREKYLHRGRYFVAFSILGGWVVGYFAQVSETVVAILFALVAGSVILNVLKEELPEERKSNFWAFLIGLLFYSALLVVI